MGAGQALTNYATLLIQRGKNALAADLCTRNLIICQMAFGADSQQVRAASV